MHAVDTRTCSHRQVCICRHACIHAAATEICTNTQQPHINIHICTHIQRHTQSNYTQKYTQTDSSHTATYTAITQKNAYTCNNHTHPYRDTHTDTASFPVLGDHSFGADVAFLSSFQETGHPTVLLLIHFLLFVCCGWS